MKKKNNSSNGLFVQRMFAFIFDVVIVSFVVSFICMPFIDYESINNLSESAGQIMVDYSQGNIDTNAYISSACSIFYRLAKKQGFISLVTIFFNILYFVVYQFYKDGRTLGKKLFGIKIVSNDSSKLTMNNYIYRAFVINSVLIDMIIFAFVVFASQKVWFAGALGFGVLNYIILFICFLMIVFSKDGRGLHDLLGNTKVIQCRK